MTRKDYIHHLEKLRQGLLTLIDYHYKTTKDRGILVAPTDMEIERTKKTEKAFDDLATRLYEDGAVSGRIMKEKADLGDLEQGEFSFPYMRDIRMDAFTEQGETEKAEEPETPPAKDEDKKAKAKGKKGGAK